MHCKGKILCKSKIGIKLFFSVAWIFILQNSLKMS